MPIGFAYFREVVEPCLPNLSDKMGSPKVEKYDAYIVSKLLFLQLFHAMDCAKGIVSKALSNVEVFIKLLHGLADPPFAPVQFSPYGQSKWSF